MSSEVLLAKRDHALLIGDGLIFTTATSAAAIGISLGLWALAGSPSSNVFWALTNVVLMFGGGIAGVLAAWFLHGRRITGAAALGAAAGVVVGQLMIPLIAGLSFLMEFPMKLFTAWEFAGPVAMLSIVSVAFLALFVWLLIDAGRDLAPSRRGHVRLDVARIAAAIVFAAYSGVVLALAMAQPGGEMGEAIIFALAAGVVGGAMVAGADAATVFIERQKGAKPTVAAGV